MMSVPHSAPAQPLPHASEERYGVTVLIYTFNQEHTLPALLDRLLSCPVRDSMHLEILIVDDGSTDSTPDTLHEYVSQFPNVVRVVRHQKRQGKSAALCSAAMHAQYTFCIVQDPDLGYDFVDYPALLQPLIDAEADAVYGTRFPGQDIETGCKAIRTSLLQSLPLRSDRFGFTLELMIKLEQRQAIVVQVPVGYRDHALRRHFSWTHAAAKWLARVRHGLMHDIYKDPGQTILHAFSHAPRFNRWMADTIQPFLGRRVLEIGAGMGNLTQHLFEQSMEYTATDIDVEHLARLRRRFVNRAGLRTQVCDLSNPADFEALGAAQVDTIVCLNVLEHVEDEQTALRNMYSALQEGGRAIVLVPQGPEIFGTMDTALGHCRRYTNDHLRQALQGAGFCVQQVLPFNRVSRPGWYVNGRVLQRKTVNYAQLRLFDQFVSLWRRVDHRLPWPATSLIAVAVKPNRAMLGSSAKTK